MNDEQFAAIARISTLKADNADDIKFLAELIDGFGDRQRPFFAAFVWAEGLITPLNPELQVLMNGLREKHGEDADAITGALANAFLAFPSICEEIIQFSAEHVLHGTDTVDANSVGGWSQAEVTKAAACIVAMVEIDIGNTH